MNDSLDVNSTEPEGNRCLDIVASEVFPYFSINETANPITVNGLLFEILQTYAKKFGICYILRKPNNKEQYLFGIKLSNGSYNGMIGEAQREETDLLCTALSITYDRMQAIDFSEPFDTVIHTVMFQYPTLQPDIFGFVRPFKFMSWLLLFVGMVWMSLLFKQFSWFKNRSVEQDEEANRKQRDSQHTFLNSLALFLGQAINISRFERHERPFLITWLLGLVIITSIYKSNLKAMMTAPKISVPFNTLEEMVGQMTLPYALFKGSYLHSVSKESPEGSLLKRLYDTMLPPLVFPPVADVSNGVLSVAAFSIASEGLFHQQFTKYGYCKTTYMKEKFLEVNVAFGIPKNRTWKNDLDEVIVRLKEAGIVSHWMKEVMPNASYCILKSNMIDPTLKPLTMKNFYGTYSMLFVGFALSAVVFMFEIIVGRWHNARIGSGGPNSSSGKPKY